MKPLFTNQKLTTMKKIYFLLALLVSFFGGTATYAQYQYTLDEDYPFITEDSQLSSPWTDPNEGSLANMLDGQANTFWHSSWHDNPPHNVNGSHFFQVEMPDDYYDDDEMLIAFRYVRRNNADNDHTIRWSVYGSNDTPDYSDEKYRKALFADPLTEKEEWGELLAEIETPFGSKNETCDGDAFNPQGYKYLRFYCEDATGTSGYGYRVYFHVGDFQLYPAVKNSEAEAALKELEATVEKYADYYDEDYFPQGDKPGLFSEELVMAFLDAYDAADEAVWDEIDDVDEIKRLQAELIAAYDTIWTSRVPITLENGYYRFRTVVRYYQYEIDPTTGDKTDEKVYSEKYMRAKLNGEQGVYEGCWGTPDDMMQDASALWKVTKLEDGRYDIMNMGYDMRLDTIARSTTVTLSKESPATFTLSAVYTDDEDNSWVNMRNNDEDDYSYLHQCDHNAKEGEGEASGSRMVGWVSTFDMPNRTPGASEWIPELVPAEEAEEILKNFEPYKNREVMLAAYDSIMTASKTNLDIAIDPIHVDLITEASQLSSPCSDSSEGQHIEYLIDGDGDTFWHTDWHSNYSGTFQDGKHYVQVQFNEPVNRSIYLDLIRRKQADSHPTEWVVFGSNDPEADDDDWVELDSLSTPYEGEGTHAKSKYFDPKDYTVLRLLVIDTKGASYGFRTFWHSAELQLAYEEPNPNAQAISMGDVVPALQAVVEKYDTVSHDNVTVEMYEELKAAYEAFMAKFVDPTVLRDYLASVKGFEEKVVVGTDPGFWTSDADAVSFKQIYDNAVAYDEAGHYTASESEGYKTQLEALVEKINSTANPVQAGKWYRMRFATEEFYEDHGWDKLPGGETIEYSEQIQQRTSDYLWGKYAAAGELQIDSVARTDGEEGKVAVYSSREAENSELGIGDRIYFFNDEDLQNKDMSYWRFIALGDTAFIMQNKATGMFINAQRVAVLSAQPSMFQPEPAGYGMNYLKASSLTRNSLKNNDQNFLHAQVQQNVLVHYNRNSDWDNKRCRFYLEEVGPVEADYDGTSVNVPMAYGSINTYCFPVEMTPVEGQGYKLWSVAKAEENKLTLVEIKTSVYPGRPFIAVYADTAQYIAGEDPEMVEMKKGYDFVLEPQATDLLKGTFEGTSIKIGSIIADGNKFSVVKSSYNVGINGAYITTGDSEDNGGFDRKLEVVVDFGDGEDGIATALANVSKVGAVYTLDGRLVSKKATLNDMSKFGKGIYILNGTKVTVK